MAIWLQQVATFAGDAARHATVAWATSSSKCRAAVAFSAQHVLSTCGGFADELPAAFTPGFGPFALAWGWILVGMVLGILLGLHFWDFLARLEQFWQRIDRIRRLAAVAAVAAADAEVGGAPGLAAIPPWLDAARNAFLVAQGPQRIILQRLVEEGDPALQLLAAAMGGVSRRAALERVLGHQVVQAHAHAWRL